MSDYLSKYSGKDFDDAVDWVKASQNIGSNKLAPGAVTKEKIDAIIARMIDGSIKSIKFTADADGININVVPNEGVSMLGMFPVATEAKAGVMTAEDKKKLNALYEVGEVPDDGGLYVRQGRSWAKIQNIVIDKERGVMVVDGKAYQLTESKDVYPDYIMYGQWVISNISGVANVIPYTGGSYRLFATASRTRKQHYTDGTTTDMPNETVDVIDFSVISGGATITGRTLLVSSTTEARNIVVRATYEGLTKDTVFNQESSPIAAYYGASSTEPSNVDRTKSKVLDGVQTTIEVTTALADKKRSIWVAVPKGCGWNVANVVDSDNDSVGFETKEIDGMILFHATSLGYIVSTYRFTLKKI